MRMIFSINENELKAITDISAALGKNFSIVIKPDSLGYKINWVGNNKSYMWRSYNWNINLVELYDPKNYGDITHIYEIKEL